MNDKRLALDAAAFLDSEEARALAPLVRGDQRTLIEAILACVYFDIGKQPGRLDGEDLTGLLREHLPARLALRDPLAGAALETLTAYLAHLETRALVPEAFELRLALDRHGDAFLAAVASGPARGRRSHTAAKPVVHVAPKLGRNDPCFCGSGAKFKKCHGKPS